MKKEKDYAKQIELVEKQKKIDLTKKPRDPQAVKAHNERIATQFNQW